MRKTNSAVALIPARGGSKGIQGKNIRKLCGKPLIAYSIQAAYASGIFERVIVSTDSREIADVAREYCAEVPFVRPDVLSTDSATSMDVVMHAMQWLEEGSHKADYIFLLQPTSPLRTPEDICAAYRLVLEKNAEAVVSVCECDHHPFYSNVLPPDGSMSEFVRRDGLNKNRQELQRYYRLNGAIYVARWDSLRRSRKWYMPNSYAYVMDRERSVDIDSLVDFRLAESLLSEEVVS